MNKKRLLLFNNQKKAWSVVLGGTTYIDAGSEASIDNLADGAFTLEGYFKFDQLANASIFFNKSTPGTWTDAGFHIFANSGDSVLYSDVACATSKAWSPGLVTGWESDKIFHHFAFQFDDAGDRYPFVYIDGVEFTYMWQVAGVGAVVDDSALSLSIGNGIGSNDGIHGNVGWIRISNIMRYTAPFIPPSRLLYPTVDANTVRLFKMNEGTGTTIIDYSANAQNATLTNGTWIKV